MVKPCSSPRPIWTLRVRPNNKQNSIFVSPEKNDQDASDAESGFHTGDADAPRLLSLCEPRLCSKMAAADCAEWPRPALQRIDGVTLDHVRIIVGGQRETFSPTKTAEENAAATGITPTSVGRDMVILSRDADFEGVSDMVRRFLFLDYTEQYLRSLLVDHGMTVQFAVDVNCVLNAPSSSAAPGDEEQEAAAQIKQTFEQRTNRTWHCLVGRNFACYVTYESKSFAYFYIGQQGVCLFCTD